ncbi:hypothetical protein V1264_005134 [Littorina saxatilis]|uniref:Apple domain-containing protein n=1 Tax=Littorina saxatilis TaxID=31220 RepID=A0AAN9AYL7_9CAEN
MTTSLIPIMVLSMGVIAASITGRVFQRKGVDGKMFSERILFNTNTHSLIECALLCHHLKCCLTFTFSEVTHLCQGHFAVVTVNTPSSPADGAVTFSRENNESWLSRPCANGCPTATECGVECDSDRGECSCSPYFYYSVSLNTCVPSCSTPHTTYVEYKGHDLSGHDLSMVLTTENFQECKDWCSANDDCRLIVASPTVPRCWFKYMTAAERPAYWIPSNPVFVNFQKTCA